jgi:hypothetical protein
MRPRQRANQHLVGPRLPAPRRHPLRRDDDFSAHAISESERAKVAPKSMDNSLLAPKSMDNSLRNSFISTWTAEGLP